MCHKSLSSGPLRLATWAATGPVFHPTAPWMPALAFNGLQFDLMIRGITGDSFQARPAYQFASVRPDKPGTPTTDFGWASTEGWHRFATTPPSLDTYFFWRPGIEYSVGDEDSFGSADVQLETQFFSTCELVGNQTIEVQPYNDNTSTAIHPVTGWIPSVNAKYVKAAIVVSNNISATLQNQIYARWANDKSAPLVDWAAVEGGYNTPASGNTERNTQPKPTMGLTIGGAYVQFGLGTKRSSGTNRATIHVATILQRV